MAKNANKKKSGSKSVKSYDPANTIVSGGKRPKVARMYSPAVKPVKVPGSGK